MGRVGSGRVGSGVDKMCVDDVTPSGTPCACVRVYVYSRGWVFRV